MKVIGLSHVTLADRDLERSVAFYSGLLGFAVRMRKPASAYPEAGAMWLALVIDKAARMGPLTEYSHVALSLPATDLGGMAARLSGAGVTCWQETEQGDSFYFLDPDGHKLELHPGDLSSRLAAGRGRGRRKTFEKEFDRIGDM